MSSSQGRPIVGEFYVTLDHTDNRFTVEIFDQTTQRVIVQTFSFKNMEMAAGKALLSWMDVVKRGLRAKKEESQNA